MTKRIHKTLEEVEAENEFDVMNPDQSGGFEAYEEDDEPSDDVDEYEDPDEEEPEESFEELIGIADETDDIDEVLSPPEDYIAPDRPRGEPPTGNTGPTPAIIAGIAITAGGFVLATMAIVSPTSGGPLTQNLGAAGLTPGLIVCMGLMILTFVAIVRRQNKTVQAQLEWVMGNHEANAEILDSLYEVEHRGDRGTPTSSEDLEQILHSLLRQDEKINNLTKALKMYGKPLVEVNRLASENGQKSKLLSTQIGDLKELIEQLGQPQDMSDVHEKLESIAKQVTGEVSKVVSALPKDDGTAEILQTLRRELGQINETVARVQTAAPAAQSRAAPAAQPSKPTPPPASPQASTTPAGEGPATSISGTAKSSGKSVMGAIAKLKKMR